MRTVTKMTTSAGDDYNSKKICNDDVRGWASMMMMMNDIDDHDDENAD